LQEVVAQVEALKLGQAASVEEAAALWCVERQDLCQKLEQVQASLNESQASRDVLQNEMETHASTSLQDITQMLDKVVSTQQRLRELEVERFHERKNFEQMLQDKDVTMRTMLADVQEHRRHLVDADKARLFTLDMRALKHSVREALSIACRRLE